MEEVQEEGTKVEKSEDIIFRLKNEAETLVADLKARSLALETSEAEVAKLVKQVGEECTVLIIIC
jgi:N-methylhydantoinase B/oxoprolinase/acetone carboxylase alpha subunit